MQQKKPFQIEKDDILVKYKEVRNKYEDLLKELYTLIVEETYFDSRDSTPNKDGVCDTCRIT